MAIGFLKCAKSICDVANRKSGIFQSHRISDMKFRAQVPIRSKDFRQKLQHAMTPRSSQNSNTSSTRRESNNASVCECLVFIQACRLTYNASDRESMFACQLPGSKLIQMIIDLITCSEERLRRIDLYLH